MAGQLCATCWRALGHVPALVAEVRRLREWLKVAQMRLGPELDGQELRATVRGAALEEAAQRAEDMKASGGRFTNAVSGTPVADEIAAAIRALKG